MTTIGFDDSKELDRYGVDDRLVIGVSASEISTLMCPKIIIIVPSKVAIKFERDLAGCIS
jgi:hypothetical protein